MKSPVYTHQYQHISCSWYHYGSRSLTDKSKWHLSVIVDINANSHHSEYYNHHDYKMSLHHCHLDIALNYFKSKLKTNSVKNLSFSFKILLCCHIAESYWYKRPYLFQCILFDRMGIWMAALDSWVSHQNSHHNHSERNIYKKNGFQVIKFNSCVLIYVAILKIFKIFT